MGITKNEQLKRDLKQLTNDMFESQNFFSQRVDGNDPVSTSYMYGAHEIRRFREEIEKIINKF